MLGITRSRSPRPLTDLRDSAECAADPRSAVLPRFHAALLEKGNAFIAVGALHLPGERGLIELLREQGYTVSPADR